MLNTQTKGKSYFYFIVKPPQLLPNEMCAPVKHYTSQTLESNWAPQHPFPVLYWFSHRTFFFCITAKDKNSALQRCDIKRNRQCELMYELSQASTLPGIIKMSSITVFSLQFSDNLQLLCEFITAPQCTLAHSLGTRSL